MLLVVLVGLGLWAALPRTAWAHAALVRSQPAPGALLGAPPTDLRLWFSEPVPSRLVRLEVYDDAGQPVGGGHLRSLPGEPTGLVMALLPLGPGSYRVSWQVLSRADGHVSKGEFSFGVTDQGSAAALAPPDVGVPVPEAGSTASTAPAEAYLRALVFLLAAWLVGGALFARIMSSQATLPQAPLVGPAVLLLLVVLAWSAVWGLHAAGAWSAVPSVLRSQPGRVFVARDLAALALLLVTVLRPGARLWVGLVFLVSLSLGSHAAATGDPLAPVLDWIHQVAAAAWAGGLAHLAWLAWRHGPSVPWGVVVRRFSNLAIASVGLLALTGLYAGAQELGSLAAVRHTVFGQLLSVKSILTGAAVVLGTVHFLRWRPGPDRGARRFRWSLLMEVLAVAGVLAVTGLLTSRTPGRLDPDTHAMRLTDRAGDWRFALELRPGWTGANQLELRLRPPEGAAAPRRVELALGVEPHPGHRVWVLETDPSRAAPFEYVAATNKLTVPWNRWRAEVRIWTGDGAPRVGSAGFALREPVDVLRPVRPAPPRLVVALLLALLASGAALAAVRWLRRRRPEPTRAVAVGGPQVAP